MPPNLIGKLKTIDLTSSRINTALYRPMQVSKPVESSDNIAPEVMVRKKLCIFTLTVKYSKNLLRKYYRLFTIIFCS